MADGDDVLQFGLEYTASPVNIGTGQNCGEEPEELPVEVFRSTDGHEGV